MLTKPRLVQLSALLIALSLVWGCSKKPAETSSALQSTNQTSATTTSAATTNADGGANSASAPPAANGAAGASNQAPAPLTIPAGTPITIRLQQRLSSASAVAGERFEAVLDQPIVVDNQTIAPIGAPVFGHVVFARRSGRLHHPGELGLTLDSVTVGQQQNVALATSRVAAKGGSHKKRNWAFIGGGAGGGALIGALAAGGKGALIGGPIGAAAGTTTAFITGKKDVAFGSERRLRFRLNQDVSVAG